MKRTCNMGLRMLSLVMSLVTALLLVLPVAAASNTEADQVITYACKVYYGPHDIMIGRFEDGMKLKVLSESGDYYAVDCYDMTGYIAKSQVRVDGEEYYVNCDPESTDSVPMEYVSLPEALRLRSALLQTAMTKLGCRYIHGNAGPNSFDCSGLTSYVYAQHGYKLERGSQEELMDGIIVSPEGLQVGDLIFYRNRVIGKGIGHVAMYAGNGQIIHADSRGVRFTDMDDGYYSIRYACARRVINVSAAQIEQIVTPSAGSVMMRGLSNGGLR